MIFTLPGVCVAPSFLPMTKTEFAQILAELKTEILEGNHPDCHIEQEMIWTSTRTDLIIYRLYFQSELLAASNLQNPDERKQHFSEQLDFLFQKLTVYQLMELLPS